MLFGARVFTEEGKPIDEDRLGCCAGRYVVAEREARKLGRQQRIAQRSCTAFEIFELLDCRRVEIACGNFGIVVALVGKKSREIAHIFPLQRRGVIFRMALEKDEAALELPGEDVDAGNIGPRQYLIAMCDEIPLSDLVVPRMRGTLSEAGRPLVNQSSVTLAQS